MKKRLLSLAVLLMALMLNGCRCYVICPNAFMKARPPKPGMTDTIYVDMSKGNYDTLLINEFRENEIQRDIDPHKYIKLIRK